MKLIIQNNKISAIATYQYEGPEHYINAPENFDEKLVPYYRYDSETNSLNLNSLDVLEQQTQDRLDNFAKTKGYHNISVACTYSSSNNPTYKLEGNYCVSSRDDTWSSFYNIMDSGITINSFADLEPLLPALEWPIEPEIVIEQTVETANTPD